MPGQPRVLDHVQPAADKAHTSETHRLTDNLVKLIAVVDVVVLFLTCIFLIHIPRAPVSALSYCLCVLSTHLLCFVCVSFYFLSQINLI